MSRLSIVAAVAIAWIPSIGLAQPATCGNRPESQCQQALAEPGQISDGITSTVADAFQPATSGTISTPCFTGWYASIPRSSSCEDSAFDSFRIRYYANNNGLPGTILAEFSQAAGTLTIDRAQTGRTYSYFDYGCFCYVTANEWAFSATHASFNVAAGECYFIEIINILDPNSCNWSWGMGYGGDNRSMVDYGPPNPNYGYDYSDYVVGYEPNFCFDVALQNVSSCWAPPPAEDVCENAVPLTCGVAGSIENILATSDGETPTDCFSPYTVPEHTVWFSFVAAGTEAVVDTCASTIPDTILSVYSGTCGALTEIDCNDDTYLCGLHASVLLRNLTVGETYYVRVGGAPGNGSGTATVTVNCAPNYAAPVNSTCPAATMLTYGNPVQVDLFAAERLNGASVSCEYPSPNTGSAVRGVWYSFVGDGTSLTVSTCPNTVDTELVVFCGSCETPNCVGYAGYSDCGSSGALTFCSEPGVTYYAYVAGEYGDTGDIFVVVDSDFTPCVPLTVCTTGGACCLGDNCTFTTEAGCLLAGGEYRGDNVQCIDIICGTVGRCCTTYSCSISNQSNCFGNFTPNETCDNPCPIGACCDYGSCRIDLESNCSPGGWQGVFTTCEANPCPFGACCILQDTFQYCVVQTEENCLNSGASVEWRGLYSTCETQQCEFGACCMGDSCIVTGPMRCSQLSGQYLGSGTNCGLPSFSLVSTGGAFEDISLTGLPAYYYGPTDFGFTFSFLGADYKSAFISNFGMLIFYGPLGAYTPIPSIPDPGYPNAFIAALYGNYVLPASYEDKVQWQTLGDAPNRRFIVQYNNMQVFDYLGTNLTFQIVLFETSNKIEMRYQNVGPAPYPGAYLAGVEDPYGINGFSFDASNLTPGTSKTLTPKAPVSPCNCPGDFNHNRSVEVADIFAFLNAWFAQFNTCTSNCSADINHSGTVEVADIFAFLNQWFSQFGRPCP